MIVIMIIGQSKIFKFQSSGYCSEWTANCHGEPFQTQSSELIMVDNDHKYK